MKKFILTSLFALSLASAGGVSVLADHHCSCDQECTEKCSKGDHKDCSCETCDCGKGESCKHGKCATHHGKESAGKKAGKTSASAPAADATHSH